MRRRWTRLADSTLILTLVYTSWGERQNSLVAIEHVTVVDAEAGARLRDHTVLLNGNGIVELGRTSRLGLPRDVGRLDGGGNS